MSRAERTAWRRGYLRAALDLGTPRAEAEAWATSMAQIAEQFTDAPDEPRDPEMAW